MEKFRNYWKRSWHIWVLIIVMLVALGVRSWNVEDTLYFRMDQARDAKLIMAAFEGGIGELPLLGPRAAGSYLRLGPIFYYFQFASAKIFNSIEPYVLAFPDLLFSILTIPLFYYFLRNFFSKKVSIAVISVFASSFMLTQYSRFAWNPNSIPFWALLTFLGAYKCVVSKSSKKAGLWLLVAAFGYAIASQLHFTAFLALPIVIVVFWAFYWPKKIKFKFWVLALTIFAFFYIPMALSEGFTDFDNVHQFFYALSTKGSDDVPLGFQLEHSLRLHAQYYSMLLTSYGNIESNEFIWFFFFVIIFSFWRFNKIWKTEKGRKKKALIVLIVVWFLVFAALYSKLAMDIHKPRFWLLVVFLPYIFLALTFQWFEGFKHKKIARVLVIGVTTVLILGNSYAVGYWYYALETQKKGEGSYVRDLLLKQSDLVGVKQMRIVARDWVEISGKNNKQICYRSEKSYLSPYGYILDIYQPKTEVKRISFSKDTNEKCSFVSVRHGDPTDKKPIQKSHVDEFDVVSQKVYNRMIIWELDKKNEVTKSTQEGRKNNTEEEQGVAKQEDLKEKETQDEKREDIQNEEEVEDKKEAPKKLRRKERVFWKHVFGKEKYKG